MNTRFIGHKDVDRYFLDKLDDRDLLSICNTNSYLYHLCDDDFFKNKFKKNYDHIYIFFEDIKLINYVKNWKKIYLDSVYLIAKVKGAIQPGKASLQIAAELGNIYLVKYYITRAADLHLGMYGAGIGNHRNIIDLLIFEGGNTKDDLDWGLMGAAKGGHWSLVAFFLDKGANDIYSAIDKAIEGGKIEIMEYLIGLIRNSQAATQSQLIIIKIIG